MNVAQFNISKERYAIDDPAVKDFVDALDRVNAAAERAPGFVWRLHDESGNATAIRPYEDDQSIIFNLSVWESVETLKEFAFGSPGHTEMLRRRSEWFHRQQERSYVLWWIPEDEVPSLDEAKVRLQHLRDHGPTELAFTFDTIPAAVADA